ERVEEVRRLLEQAEENEGDLKMPPSPKASVPPNVPTPLPSGPAAAIDLLPEQMFGRYRILRKLGEGGMGSVYLAHDTQMDRLVALKVPKFKAEDNSTNLPEILERFYREARAAATLDHPNICTVYDVNEINGIHYLTMAYVEGKALSEFRL